MNPVNATSLYVSASRSVLQCDPRDPRALAELCKLLPFFRQSLSCLVCGECGFDLCIIVTINYSVGSWQMKQNRLKWCFQTRWVFPDTRSLSKTFNNKTFYWTTYRLSTVKNKLQHLNPHIGILDSGVHFDTMGMFSC